MKYTGSYSIGSRAVSFVNMVRLRPPVICTYKYIGSMKLLYKNLTRSKQHGLCLFWAEKVFDVEVSSSDL